MAQNIGPVQLLAVGFDPDARFEGRIMDELENLERHETIRILNPVRARRVTPIELRHPTRGRGRVAPSPPCRING